MLSELGLVVICIESRRLFFPRWMGQNHADRQGEQEKQAQMFARQNGFWVREEHRRFTVQTPRND